MEYLNLFVEYISVFYLILFYFCYKVTCFYNLKNIYFNVKFYFFYFSIIFYGI